MNRTAATANEPLSLNFALDATTLAAALQRLAAEDAVSLPLLGPADCRALTAAAETLAYRPATPVIGSGEKEVQQDFELTVALEPGDPFHRLAAQLETLVADAVTKLDPAPLTAPLLFNDLIVQRYQPGSAGITPHRDHICYEGLVALATLCGHGRFFLCADRSGRDLRELPMPPGGLILLRAPGFAGRRDRPFHTLSEISETRIGVGIRHDIRRAG